MVKRREEKRKSNVSTMKSFQGKETDELEQRYMKLQQYWETLKQSNQTKPSRKYSSSPSNNTNNSIKAIEIENNSPRYLMSMLQQDPSEAWMIMRSNAVASREIRRERWEAIQSGKIKGRRLLFVPMEEECDQSDHDTSSNCEETVSFCYSEDEHELSSGNKGNQQHDCCDSSSPCNCLLGGSHVEDMVAETRSVVVKKGSYAVFFLGLAGFLLLLAIFMSGGGCDNNEEDILVPT